MKVTIAGCGHGGQALAADMASRDIDVCLYANNEYPGGIKKIISNGYIECVGEVNCKGKIKFATTKIKDAVKDASVIFLVLPSNAHLTEFQKMLPFLKTGQIVVALAANFTPILMYRELKRVMPDKDITIAGVSSLPYACRVIESGKVNVCGLKKTMRLATIPKYHSANKVIDLIRDFFPTNLLKYDNILELGLNITSGISHTLNTLFNAGRIGEGKHDFYFYKEGITLDTASVIERLDEERRKIGSFYSLKLPSYLELMYEFYGNSFSSIYDFFKSTPVHNGMKFCPKSVHERYLSQDIPHVLVPWYNLGKIAGYDSVLIRSIITLASELNNKDYQKGSLFSDRKDFEISCKELLMYYVNNGQAFMACS